MSDYLKKHLEEPILPFQGSFADIRQKLLDIEREYSLWNDLKIVYNWENYLLTGWQMETKVDVYIRNKHNDWQWREEAKRLYDQEVLEKQIADYLVDPEAPYPEGILDIHTKDMLHKIKKQRILEEREL